jgi:hypothetical protein
MFSYLLYNPIDLSFRETRVQKHLKKVYGTLSISMFAAAAGAYVHLFTGLMSVSITIGNKTPPPLPQTLHPSNFEDTSPPNISKTLQPSSNIFCKVNNSMFNKSS